MAPGAVLVAAFLLIGAQGAAGTLSIGLPTPSQLIATIALWSTSGVVLASLFATATRAPVLMLVAGAAALVDAIVITVLLSLGIVAGWDAVQLLPVLLAVVAAALGTFGARGLGGRLALPIAAGAVALFYVTAAVVQGLRFGASVDLVTTIVRSMPIAILAIAAALALAHASSRLLPSLLLWALAASLLGAPILSALTDSPPVPASLAVLIARVVLVVVAGVLVLRGGRERTAR
ncbi:hypothetical protein GCM10009846_17960 [Agrococcus versicolor]|uniref:Uncharacterized protein n=1 Tax=Agrococcus versicolor TaxID=501482 RepID=A0ABP5MIJ9_9MICO